MHINLTLFPIFEPKSTEPRRLRIPVGLKRSGGFGRADEAGGLRFERKSTDGRMDD